MGLSSSKYREKATNPLQVLQLQELKRERIQKQITNNQNKQKHTKHKNYMQKQQKRIELRNSVQNLAINSVGNENKEYKPNNNSSNSWCTFIMDYCLQTTEIFHDMENDVKKYMDDLYLNESEINSKLENHSILFGNVFYVDTILYKALTESETSFPLQIQTIYVVFENIEVVLPNDANYDSITTPCKVEIETEFPYNFQCKKQLIRNLFAAKWKGYQRLKLADTYMDKTDVGLEQFTSNYNNSNYSRLSSGYDTDSEYDDIDNKSKFKKVIHNELDSERIPNTCFSAINDFLLKEKNFNILKFSSEMDSDSNSESSDTTLCNIPPNTLYLNSQQFMQYFAEIFKSKLGLYEKITQKEFKNVEFTSNALFTSNYEIIPAIHVPQNGTKTWPECAHKFRTRYRPLYKDPNTDICTQWPTVKIIQKICSTSYYLVPSSNSTNSHVLHPIEWYLIFPTADRYLQQELNYTQIKVLLLTQAFLQTFVKNIQITQVRSKIAYMLRTHMYWQCEKNFSSWPEEQISQLLLHFINSFAECLQQKIIKDFFIEQRNLCEYISDDILLEIYTTLSDIETNPLIYVMALLQQLHFTNQILPKLNFSQIFTILSENNLNRLSNVIKNPEMYNKILVDVEFIYNTDGNSKIENFRRHYLFQILMNNILNLLSAVNKLKLTNFAKKYFHLACKICTNISLNNESMKYEAELRLLQRDLQNLLLDKGETELSISNIIKDPKHIFTVETDNIFDSDI